MLNHKAWVVMTSLERPISEIVEALMAAGFSVVSIVEDIGRISGESDEATAKAVRNIGGVTQVYRQDVEAAPPDSSETW